MADDQLGEEYTCRVCGFRYDTPTWDGGSGSHDICLCCGTQFGYQDTVLDGVWSVRAKWAAEGHQWSSPEFRPPDWEPGTQLAQVPDRWADASVLAFKLSAPPLPAMRTSADPEAQRAEVLGRFLRDGRLTHFPATGREWTIVLEHIAAGFEPGVKYRRLEIDKLLKAWHGKPADLLSRLTDQGFVANDDQYYWRAER
ncbi:DUF2087 domain-containing protein [Kibdelosporangium phytohabitans]|uniref:DUF2087 domain-containing protein n=1 Tax=Kibdelosporangium phytohabitans TaxID=860235 RepID=A0A0N9HTV8_9PSEU|nr:DUF2087 domain-containing protein [Kibdelosporangium phytohabitans]ALG10680.1 hypothetical protein AOZ06_30665 [Kibdelosporangium phytohabitans]MBE1461809.1 rubredoxin [Kibdelosporangium phytohabitans]